MLEPTECGVLPRSRLGIVRVDLDDVAEPTRLGRVVRLGGVETRVNGLPAVHTRVFSQPVSVAPNCVRIANKVVMEVLLARQDGAPGRRTPRTVAERADHPMPAPVVSGLEEMTAGCGTGQLERRAGCDSPVERRAPDVAPGAARGRALQLHHAEALRGHCRLESFALLGFGGRRREHDLAVGELVIATQQPSLTEAVGDDDGQEVVVVAELEFLSMGTRRLGIEMWRLVEKRVAPTQDRRPAVTGWDDQRVEIVWSRVDRIELQIAGRTCRALWRWDWRTLLLAGCTSGKDGQRRCCGQGPCRYE